MPPNRVIPESLKAAVRGGALILLSGMAFVG
jgi:hypothetical protein